MYRRYLSIFQLMRKCSRLKGMIKDDMKGVTDYVAGIRLLSSLESYRDLILYLYQDLQVDY